MNYAAHLEYYKSIKRPFEETIMLEDWESRRDKVTGVLVFMAVFSFVPAIPGLLYYLLPRIWEPVSLDVWGWNVNPFSFLFLWIVCFGLTTFLVGLWNLATRPSKGKRAMKLSPSQMRFCLCYALIDEIEAFQTNKRPQHLEQAEAYLRRLDSSISRLLRPHLLVESGDDVSRLVATGTEFAPLLVLNQGEILISSQLPWLRIESSAVVKILGLVTFHAKFRDRIKDKKDLRHMSAMLADLGAYFFTMIDEVSEASDAKKELQEAGLGALQKFGLAVKDLPPYRSEVKPATTEEAVKKQVARTGSRITAPFTHQNVLLCFAAWYLLLLFLIVLGLGIAYRYKPELPVDTVIISTVVGGPVAGAVTAVTVSRLRAHKDDR